jgi:tRNA (guanosine-2'-O-)-methyltransferase
MSDISQSTHLSAEEEEKGLFNSDLTDELTLESSADPPRRLLRAEAILSHRTNRIVLVLEHLIDSHNHQAILRTAESLGIQYIYAIDTGRRKQYVVKGGIVSNAVSDPIASGSMNWITLRTFSSSAECVAQLRAENFAIWSTCLSSTSVPLTTENFSCLPPKVAVVIGREVDGVSPELLEISDKHIFLPMFGFTESYNVSVATALVLQRLFDIDKNLRGTLSTAEKSKIREHWYRKLASKPIYVEENLKWLEKAEEFKWNTADLRPQEALRIPRIAPQLRKKIAEQGDRVVIANKKEGIDQVKQIFNDKSPQNESNTSNTPISPYNQVSPQQQ